ncbi:hypothetical protein PSET11_00785 [Arthrobacter ulcerisalmonis]|uniref:Uncharacterized protein n=1 Tax=Arthrobacter ulcerisalmonis TaxID=2483813 RepID=A0A3P5WD39_9MICC|nr:hypothetical protein [Arthrobacter ulcerisalmonis]VDC21423.1 hypothetical protein PSET11_00785 [Arthrobacter ulcerisalmonis]
MSQQRKGLKILIYGSIASGALALLTAVLTSVLFQEIESKGDVTNAQDFGWRAVALAVLSVVLFTVYLIRRNTLSERFRQTP